MHHGGEVRDGQQTRAPEREALTEHSVRGGQEQSGKGRHQQEREKQYVNFFPLSYNVLLYVVMAPCHAK